MKMAEMKQMLESNLPVVTRWRRAVSPEQAESASEKPYSTGKAVYSGGIE
jgi:hypothetical protein